MKTIKLKQLELTNFKGIAHRIETFHDGENSIIGENGTGKTSIFDAFTWLLFGRDSDGRADDKANIKTLDKDNNPIMGMDNTVVGTFEIDGVELILKRSYVERWTKHSGSSEKTYEGQTTKFSWDGNDKVSQTEYKKRVAEIIDDGLFRLITDPNFFASLDVKERRKIILAMAGDITDDEIKSANCELIHFDASKNVDEQKQVAMSSKNRLIKDRDNYPARIDEQMQIITAKKQELETMKLPMKEELEARKKEAEQNIKNTEAKQNDITKLIQGIMDDNAKRLDLLKKIEEYKRAEQNFKNDNIDRENRVVKKAMQDYLNLQNDMELKKSRIESGNVFLDEKRIELEEFKAKIKELEAELIPNFDTETTCPTCHRELEPSTIETQKEELRENWVNEQKRKIAEFTLKCKVAFTEGKSYKDAIAKLEDDLEELNKKMIKLEPETKVDIKEYVEIDFEQDQIYKGMLAKLPKEVSVTEEIENQKKEIEVIKEYNRGVIAGVDYELKDFTRVDIMKADIKIAEERINVLREDEKDVNVEIAHQERIIYLCDVWNKTRTEILNRRVASNFKGVKFKMFNYTKDGNPIPTCEIVVNGVDYTTLNTASKLNAGLDIINALINYYNVKAPVFIDNRESVTNIDAPDTQIVNLIVPYVNGKGETNEFEQTGGVL